jgi:hypothetical protein
MVLGFAMLVPINLSGMLAWSNSRIARENLIFLGVIAWLISHFCALV